MQTMFTPEFFAGNRAALRESVGPGIPIIVTAHALMQKAADMAYEFRQDSSFWYLTGIDEPEIILVMDGDDEFLIVPTREAVREAFDGAINHAKLSAISSIPEIHDEIVGWEKLTRILEPAKHFAVMEPNPPYIEFYAMYANPARATLVQKLQTIAPQAEIKDIRKDIARLRMIKQKPELAAIQKAIEITAASITEAIAGAKLKKYEYEHELEAALAYGFRKRGSKGHAFDLLSTTWPMTAR
jgi:Xaa-Pro aminopeptidase